jgi:cyclophilin family peptidyl-prolyl cis-trans isomerase
MTAKITKSIIGVVMLSLFMAGGCDQEKTTKQSQSVSKTNPTEKTLPANERNNMPQSDTQSQKNPQVIMETSKGNITIELDAKAAPVTVKNFLVYVNEKFYDGTIFHRVINNFMIQGGGFDEKMSEKKTHAPIKNEAANGLRNDLGTIAMARTNDINSATAQFFINVKDNDFLNHQGSGQFGYAVFGKVVSGMDVIDAIKVVKTTSRAGMDDVPTDPVIIKSVKVVL